MTARCAVSAAGATTAATAGRSMPSQQFFDELIAAREIVTKLASHYWELTE